MNDRDDRHEAIRQTLPKWGPDVLGVPVEVEFSDGVQCVHYGWRDGWSLHPSDSPFAWDGTRILHRLIPEDRDPSMWPVVQPGEPKRLWEELVGCRVSLDWNGITRTGVVGGVSNHSLVSGSAVIAYRDEPFRVHPDDLAEARAKAEPPIPEEPADDVVVKDREGDLWEHDEGDLWVSEGGESDPSTLTTWDTLNRLRGPLTIYRAESADPTPPTTWAEWQDGDIWVDDDGDPAWRDGDDVRHVRGNGRVYATWKPRDYVEGYAPFRAPTAAERARVAKARKAANG